jgi:hemerythrin-like domain-containing protein
MKATEILSSEHRLIERLLTVLETGAWLLALEESFRPDFFIEAAGFIKGFADGRHHHKEEGVLFEMMVESGMPRAGSPVAAMLHEHEMARSYTRSMLDAAQRLKAGDPAARQEVVDNARRYAALLHQHIGMEDQIIFPIAGQLIPQQRHNDVLQGFAGVDLEQTGQGEYETYLALIRALESEVDINPEDGYRNSSWMRLYAASPA